jgi:predicted secreted protein
MYKVLSLFLFAVALTAFVAAPVLADDKARSEEQEKDKKNSHVGTFVSAKGANEFSMKDGEKEHSHTLAPDAKVVGADGKEMKLADLKAGQKIRVTTKEGDQKTATRVEVMKEKEKP